MKWAHIASAASSNATNANKNTAKTTRTDDHRITRARGIFTFIRGARPLSAPRHDPNAIAPPTSTSAIAPLGPGARAGFLDRHARRGSSHGPFVVG
jgi:hypothetical protein